MRFSEDSRALLGKLSVFFQISENSGLQRILHSETLAVELSSSFAMIAEIL